MAALLLTGQLILECTADAPASIMAFMVSKAFRGPPNPASASATTGTIHLVPVSPLAQAIWSARWSALLIRRTSAGTLFDGYRLWSG